MSLSNILGGVLVGLGQGYDEVQQDQVKKKREDQKVEREMWTRILLDQNSPPSQKKAARDKLAKLFGNKPEANEILFQLAPDAEATPQRPVTEGPPVPQGIPGYRPSMEEFAAQLNIPYATEDDRWAAGRPDVGLPQMYRQHLGAIDTEDRQRRLTEEGEERKATARTSQVENLKKDLAAVDDISKLSPGDRIVLGAELSAKYPDIPADVISRLAMGEKPEDKTFEEQTYEDFAKGKPEGYAPWDRTAFLRWKGKEGGGGSDFQPYGQPYIAGTNPDGSPIILYGKPGDVYGKPVPKTIFDPTGQSSLGGQSGYSTISPPTVPADVQNAFAGMDQEIGKLDEVIKAIPKLKSVLGPFSGRVKLFEIEKLGGMGATPEQIRAAMALRRILTSEAFSNGGKQLTITELGQFTYLNPALTDTFEQALGKAEESKKFLEDKYTLRRRYLSPRQQGQIPEKPSSASPPPDPGMGASSIPAVGDTFQGKKVLKVEKVK